MQTESPVVLVTGAAQRIGASIAHKFHHNNYRVIVHYRNSAEVARALVESLNAQRKSSAACLHADFCLPEDVCRLASEAATHFSRLDVVINNASSYYPSRLGEVTQHDWNDLFDSNLRASFFLIQALAPELQRRRGAIVNLLDSHIEKPLLHHSVYSIAKAGAVAMTKSLAVELAPNIRVNGVAPGAILWPTALSNDSSPEVHSRRRKILDQIPLQHVGTPELIADAVYFLAVEASYMTGAILRVDGGRSLNL